MSKAGQRVDMAAEKEVSVPGQDIKDKKGNECNPR